MGENLTGSMRTPSSTPRPPKNNSFVPHFFPSMRLGFLLALTYVLAIVFDLWFPEFASNSLWSPLLPGFEWLSWSSFFIGLTEVFLSGWYVALVYGLLHDFFSHKTDEITGSK